MQGNSENVDAYVTDLKNKARDCEFEHLTNSLIWDRILCGIMGDQVRGRLLREPDLTLNKAIDICRASELSQSQLKSLHEEFEIPVHKVTKQKQHDKKKCHIAEYKDEKSRKLHQMSAKHQYSSTMVSASQLLYLLMQALRAWEQCYFKRDSQ